jgi:hypothetical protein
MTFKEYSGQTLRLAVAAATAFAAIAGCSEGSPRGVVTQKAGGALSAAPAPSKGSGLVWHLPDGEVRIWDMASGTDSKEVVLQENVDPSTWKIVATGDFNGDGAGDILWSDPGAGLLSEWQLIDTSVGPSTYPTQNAPVSVQTVQGTPEPFAATAYPVDIDGDSVTDVVWRAVSMTINSGPYGAPQITTDNIRSEEWMLTSGQTVPKYDWYMDSPTMAVAGAGDFDASGYGDFVFRDSSSGDTQVVFSPGYWWDYGAVPLEWSIVGSGDFNNDGADDILWYNTSWGDVVIWYMQPGTGDILGDYWIENVPVSSGWSIDGVGDTNHDGVSDIIWEHNSGVISIWTMSPDATVADYGAVLAKPAGATFAGVIPLGPPPPVTALTEIDEQLNGTETDALIQFQGQAARPNDYVELWTSADGAYLGRIPTFQVSGNTLGAWVNTAWLQGGTSGCFAIRPWEQRRTSTSFSNQLCLHGSPNPLQARVDFVNQADNNRCVPDPVHIINRLNTNGELLAWNYSSQGYSPLDSDHYHTETIVRMPYLAGTSLDGSVFVSDFSHEPCDDPATIGDCGAHLGVAEFLWTGGRNGGVLGTNRGYNDAADWNVDPNPWDSFFPLGDPPTPHFSLDRINRVENHPGGASGIGHYVATAIQGYRENCDLCAFSPVECGSCNPIDSQGLVQIWDLADPLKPAQRSTFETFEDYNAVSLVGQGKDAVAVAITKLATNKFLMAINTNSPTSQLEFYISNGTTLEDSNLFGGFGREPDAVVPVSSPSSLADLRAHPPNWQSFNFITGCDGSLWIIGSRDDRKYPGPDAVDSYRVSIAPSSAATCGTAHPYCVTLTSAIDVPSLSSGTVVYDGEPSRVMNCSDNWGNQECSLAAGGGAYVDPDGNVIIYGTNFDNDGFDGSWVHGNAPGYTEYAANGGYIRGKEFHERHGNQAPNAGCPTPDKGWVEFYSGTAFNSHGNDPSAQILYQQHTYRDYRSSYFGHNVFSPPRSVRWCLPPGTSYQFFKGNQSGPYGYLNGTGHVAQIDDLTPGWLTYPYGGGPVGGTIESGVFIDSYQDPQGWTGTPDDSN